MEADRLIAWDAELRAVHARLRQSLAIARAAVSGDAYGAGGLRGGAVGGEADVAGGLRGGAVREGAAGAGGLRGGAAGEAAAAVGADARAAPAGLADGASQDAATAASADVLLYCTGFCVALDGHHRSEDAGLFPALVAQHPELRRAVDKLVQDHSMLSHLLQQFRGAMESGADRGALERHLEGIAAIMESHFRYEERELLGPLSTLRSVATGRELLGPLA